MKKSFKNHGITLIALVITIIVLLILAGVTIATLTGDNGILTRASDAKIETAVGAVKEALKLEQGEKVINNEKLTPEILLSEGKVSRTVQAGENDTYYMYYAIKENAYEGMQGLGKGNIASLKDVFLIDDKLNVKYIASNGKEYGDNLDNKVLEDETEIRFSSKAFSDYVSQISGVTEDEMKFKWMKNQTKLEISDSSINSLQDLVFFPNLNELILKNLTIENLNGIENCIKLQTFKTEKTEVKDYEKLSKLPSLERFDILFGKNKLDFDNVIDSLISIDTLKSFIINVTPMNTKSIKRVSELTDNLEGITFRGTYEIEKIEGLENKVNLKKLNLGGNKISKIEGLENCVNLEELDLSSNRISKVENLEHLQNLKKLYLGTNQLIDILNLDKNTKLIDLSLISNPNIKSNRNEYTEEENKRLDKIQEIMTVRNGQINIDIGQIKLFKGYKSVNVNQEDLDTLEILEGQTELESLTIGKCNITLEDIESQEILKSMKKLKTLKFSKTNVKDLTAVNKLASLRNLYLDGIENLLDLSQIEDIISQLYISGAKQEDIDSILQCDREKVTKLDIHGNFSKIPDFSVFKNMNSLLLKQNKTVTNFDIISKFDSLRELSLEDTNLHGRMIDFTQLTNLTNLNLKSNTLWDEDLEKLKALKYNINLTINLSNNSIINATALLELNENTRIDLSGNINLTKEAKETLKGHFQERVTF